MPGHIDEQGREHISYDPYSPLKPAEPKPIVRERARTAKEKRDDQKVKKGK